jgi:hypothetical protein
LFRSFGVSLVVFMMATAVRMAQADDATNLVARVLATNSPWLNPTPMTGTYSLLREPDGQTNVLSGPFSFSDVATNGWQFCRPYRVGSMIWTPLHCMAAGDSPYTVTGVGQTNWNGLNVQAVDVEFATNVSCWIGMGGQGGTSYSECNYHQIRSAYILIEPTNAVPVYMDTYTSPTNQFQYSPTWQFDLPFYSVGGGLAPQAFDWNEPSTFKEHQEFQVVADLWFFSEGEAWWGANSFGFTGLIQTLEMTNVSIGLAIPMRVTRSGSTLSIALPQTGAAGFRVEGANSLIGLWAPVETQTSSDSSSITVAVPTNQRTQFYRVTK